MMIDDSCFLFSRRFSLHIASRRARFSGRCARAALIVEKASRSENQRPFNARQQSSTTETL
jgi:hypothetical protein